MNRNLFLSTTLLLLVTAWATGCGGQPTSIATPEKPPATRLPREATGGTLGIGETVTDSAASVPQREATRAAPSSTSAATEVGTPDEAEAIIRLAREDLAQRLDLAPEAIRLVSVETMEWADTSLGCPQPGMMYAQVVTPGFRVVLEVEGEKYDYHTDQGNHVVLCQPERNIELPSPKDIKDNTPWQPVEPVEPDSISPMPRKK